MEKENRKKVIQGLARNLTGAFFPKENEIYDLIAGQYLASFQDTQTFSAEDMQVEGLPLGNLSDLGTLKILPFASLVLTTIYQTIHNEELTMPGVRRLLQEQPEIAALIKQKVLQQYPIEPKLAGEFWDKTMDVLMPRYLFQENEPSGLEESRSVELKEGVYVEYIRDQFPKYAVSFLNCEGGRIFFGIENARGLVKGGALSLKEKDAILLNVHNTRHNIFPAVSPAVFEVQYHPVCDRSGIPLADRYVVEIVVAKPVQNCLYRTSSGKRGGVYLRSDGAVDELTENEIQDELRRRSLPLQ